jgi:predicted AAA+ superfamily ATPase
LSQIELSRQEELWQTQSNLESRLIYGSYPEVIISQNNEEKENYLKEIVSSYLYKDILELDGVRHSDKITRILQLLAFQLGREVSLSEIGAQVGLNQKTIERYLDLLKKSFVIFRVNGFSRNLRKEITKTSRYYFFDIGIRNALINNFNLLILRNDAGMLWENYIIIERIKKQNYQSIHSNNYFWRTYDQKEIDWVEEREGQLFGYEIKWGNKKAKTPKDWLENYPEAKWEIVNRENYLKFIL